ncbi:MAG TPA: hypothetical protein VEJ20_08410 [Candidatus Eremiobacteraceae bacterium]|nr:hypothetical protein [Candidatus Eremiobacteraceae bacterium]
MKHVRRRGIALITVLFATTLLLVIVGVLIDLGTIQLHRATADLRAVQALAAADGGTQWVRGVLVSSKGDIQAAINHLALEQGRRQIAIDAQTSAIVSVSLLQAQPVASGGDHVDDNLESNPQALEVPVQVQSSATIYVNGGAVASRATTTLLHVFPAQPYSEVVGEIDEGGPVGIDSPGDAAGQQAGGTYTTQLLIDAYALNAEQQPQNVSQFDDEDWSDGNTVPTGALP